VRTVAVNIAVGVKVAELVVEVYEAGRAISKRDVPFGGSACESGGRNRAVSVGEFVLVNVICERSRTAAVALSIGVTFLVRLAKEVWVAVSARKGLSERVSVGLGVSV